MASKLIRNPTIITSQVDGEVFMMDIEQNSFLGLNEVASFIWDFLEEARTPDEIIAAVRENFDAPDPDAVSQDVTAFLETMLKDEMVKQADG
jgi:hypothetical protein